MNFRFYQWLDFIPQILATICFCLLLIYVFIRVKYGFWAYQPVFHVYDILYYFWSKGIIDASLPKPNKFTNFKNIKTYSWNQLSELKRNEIVLFIRQHYWQEKENKFAPSRDNFVPYFDGFSSKCYVSLYTKQVTLKDKKTNAIVASKSVQGIITSRPLQVSLLENEMRVLYVDYLCVDKWERKKGIAAQLIQTHEFNQRHDNRDLPVSLFKREDELTGIIPLCVYKTYGYSVMDWRKPTQLSPPFASLDIVPLNFHLLYDYLQSPMLKKKFKVRIQPDEGNLLSLIKTKNIFVHAILREKEICALYFFKKTCVFVDKNMEVLSCFASVYDPEEMTVSEFIQGFKYAFWTIADSNKFGYCSIEDTSENHLIIESLGEPEIISPTAYFFYNFAYSPVPSEQCFILV